MLFIWRKALFYKNPYLIPLKTEFVAQCFYFGKEPQAFPGGYYSIRLQVNENN